VGREGLGICPGWEKGEADVISLSFVPNGTQLQLLSPFIGVLRLWFVFFFGFLKAADARALLTLCAWRLRLRL